MSNGDINDTRNIDPSVGGTLFERYFTGRHEASSVAPGTFFMTADYVNLTAFETGDGLDSDHIEGTIRGIADGCMRDYNYALETLSKLPDNRYAVVTYTDLVEDPKATVEKVYQRLNLSISADFEQHLTAERSRQKRHHSSNVYSLSEFGLSEADLFEKLSGVIERFGFRPEDVPDRETTEVL